MRRLLPAACALAAILAGCGASGESSAPAPPVRLTLSAPPDASTVRDELVAIAGSVKPAAATVRVLGREVPVEGGRFSVEVPLEPGSNLIDVAASAEGRRPDFAAARVVREVRVPLPDVVGRDADAAQEELEALGLDVAQEPVGGFFDPILPGDPQVCEMDPVAETQVLPGSRVSLAVARDC